MYLVLMVQHNRAIYTKAFDDFDTAATHADELVMNLNGVTDEMPNWQEGEVFDHVGYGSETVMVTECAAPSDCVNKWKFNKSNYNNKYGK